MKTLKASALALLVASPAFAGGMAEPIMEPTPAPVVIEEEAASSSRAGILVPILAVVLIGLAMSNDN